MKHIHTYILALLLLSAPLALAETVDTDAFMQRLYNELNLSKSDYRQLINNVSDTEHKLEEVTERKLSLTEQLAQLDTLTTQSEKRVYAAKRSITEKENMVMLLDEEIELKRIAVAHQKNLLKDYIRVLYEEGNAFFSMTEGGEIDAFKMLLADARIGENLRQLAYFERLNETAQHMVDRLDTLTAALIRKQQNVEAERVRLAMLHKEYEAERAQLALQKEAKEKFLSLTLGQEKIYTQLLEQSEAQQGEVLAEIRNLDNAVNFLERRIAAEGDSFDITKYASLLDFRSRAVYDFAINAGPLGRGDFAWPVEPFKGISAFFRDPSYVGVFGVHHNAVDIPAYQGTPVRATADGVVYKAKDNGYGYSYIILAHSDGYRSVYGHVSSILVKDGQKIAQGMIIGLSGGMPGTLGAGYMTTGAHLHFELLKNNSHIDPLDYLPLSVLNEAHIKNLPKKYRDAWAQRTTSPIVR